MILHLFIIIVFSVISRFFFFCARAIHLIALISLPLLFGIQFNSFSVLCCWCSCSFVLSQCQCEDNSSSIDTSAHMVKCSIGEIWELILFTSFRSDIVEIRTTFSYYVLWNGKVNAKVWWWKIVQLCFQSQTTCLGTRTLFCREQEKINNVIIFIHWNWNTNDI